MHENEGNRVRAFLIILLSIFIIYSGRLFSMQILSGDIHLNRAMDISRRTYPIPTQRGEIFDRNFDKPLVMNRDIFAVTITPSEVPRGEMDTVINSVSQFLNLSTDEIKAKLPNQYLQLYQPLEIASNVPFDVIASLAERKNTLPGISWHIKPIRNYVNVGSLSHILGYVGDITRDELTMLYNEGYQPGDLIGKTGIEKQYDEILRGKPGFETRTVDVRGRRVSNLETIIRVPPEMGKNLVLSIDADVQMLAEKALGSRNGAAIVMKPSTGEILAMVSYPWFDPNIFTDGLSADYRALIDDPSKPLLNRAIQSSYPPASTFKIVLTTAVLSEGTFSPEQTIYCPGMINYGNQPWRCWNRGGHGRLNLRGALANSCNIYYMTVGRDNLGVDRISEYARKYGYGEITDIDLPGEIPGLIPTPQWKEHRYHERWVAGDTMNMSIGQGFTLVTPLQVCNLVSMVVNNGIIYKPHILKEVRDPITNAVEKVIQPKVLHESSISPSIYELVRQDMRGVVSNGTASYINRAVVQIAGKTGTAEFGLSTRWHSWFTAYAPYNSTNPDEQIIVTVVLENSESQSSESVLACGYIIQGYFTKQNYETVVRTFWQ